MAMKLFLPSIAKLTPPLKHKGTFRLAANNKAISIASASINSNSSLLNLKLATAVDRNSNITLSYRDLAGDQKANVIQDLAGNDLASFSNRKLENQTTRSSDPLNINTAEIDGDEVVLAFDREINSTTQTQRHIPPRCQQQSHLHCLGFHQQQLFSPQPQTRDSC
jgi:hypothetical protein